MMRAILVPGILACGLLAFGADPHWDLQYHYQQINSALTINALVFPSADRGIMCGFITDRHDNARPVVLLTNDGGAHWTETNVKEAGLSLFFLDDSVGWMVTEKGIWQTVESGRSWTKVPKAPSGLLRVWFLDPKHGFAAGLEKRVYETTGWRPDLGAAADPERGAGRPDFYHVRRNRVLGPERDHHGLEHPAAAGRSGLDGAGAGGETPPTAELRGDAGNDQRRQDLDEERGRGVSAR